MDDQVKIVMDVISGVNINYAAITPKIFADWCHDLNACDSALEYMYRQPDMTSLIKNVPMVSWWSWLTKFAGKELMDNSRLYGYFDLFHEVRYRSHTELMDVRRELLLFCGNFSVKTVVDTLLIKYYFKKSRLPSNIPSYGN